MYKFTLLVFLFLIVACGSKNEVPDLFFPKEVANFAKSTLETDEKTEPLKNLDNSNDSICYEFKHKIFIILDLKKGIIHQVHPKIKTTDTKKTDEKPKESETENFSLSSDAIGQPPLLFDGIHCVSSTDKEALFLLKCAKEPLYQYAIRYSFDKDNLITKKVFQMGQIELLTWGNLSNWPTTWAKPKKIK